MASSRDKREQRQRASAKQRAEQHDSGDKTTIRTPKDMGFLKVKEGAMKLDILEFKAGKGNPWAKEGFYWYERTYFVHRNVGPGGDAAVCPRKTANQKCPICEHLSKLSKDEDADEKLIKDLLPKERQLFLVYNHAEPEKGVQLLEISHHNFGKRLDAEVRDADEEEGLNAFAAWDTEGKTLRVGWVEDSFGGTKFMKAETIKFLSRKEDLPEELTDQVVCLDDVIKILPYDELKKLFLQEDDSESEKKGSSKKTSDDDDDKEDKPSEPLFNKGHMVSFVYKDEKKKGKVVRVDKDNELYSIQCDDREKPYNVDFDHESLKKAKAPEPVEDDDSGEDEKPSSKKSADSEKTSGKSSSASSGKGNEDESESGFKVGMKVKFTYREEPKVGKILEVDEEDEVLKVKCDDREKPYTIDMDDDVTPVTKKPPKDEDDEDEPPKKSGSKKPPKDEDDDDEDTPPKKSGKKPPKEEDNDDDIPFEDDND